MVALSSSRSPSFARLRRRERSLTLLGITAILLVRGCGYDWDAYDPRLGGGGESSSGTAWMGTSGSTSAGGSCSPKVSRPCYTGPSASEGVGACKAGSQTCNTEGTAWGPCQGEVTPISDDCSTLADEDCNGIPNDHCGIWSMRVGGSNNQNPHGMAVDATGAILVTGTTFGSANFGGSQLFAQGEGDLFIAKYDNFGTHIWSKIFGDDDLQEGYGVAVDGAGNVFVTGTFDGTLNFGATPDLSLTSAGVEDIFVVKLDPAGNALWAKSIGDDSRQDGNAIAVDAMGNAYIAGSFRGDVSFGGGPVSADEQDGVIIKLDPSGTILWGFTFGGGGDDSANTVAIDPGGNVVLGAQFQFKLSVGATTVSSKGNGDLFVAKLTAAGAPVWLKGFGSPEREIMGGIASDAAGNVIVDGIFGESIDLGCGALGIQGPADLFVAKLDPEGACLWSKGFGDSEGQDEPHVAVDGAGNVLVTDEFLGTVDFGGGPLVTAGGNSTDILVLKLDPSGNHLWSRRFGDAGDQDGRGIAADSANNVYVLGELAGSIHFGNALLKSNGGEDVCVAKLGP
jgi:hypothetical protein